MSREQDSGLWGEELAAAALRSKRYRILGRRVRVGTRDEIDIVARDRRRDVLVFAEVKTRRRSDFGRPYDAVDRDKRRAMSRAAIRYVSKLRNPRVPFRFDVVEVVGEPGDKDADIRHIENAFSLDSRYDLP